MLAHFDPAAAPLTLAVDVAPNGLGAVLAAGNARACGPFGSRSLSAGERNYSQIQKDATAIIFVFKHFYQNLYGRQNPFILKTDHIFLYSNLCFK